MEKNGKGNLNGFIFVYLVNFWFSILLIILKIKHVIDCSIIVCLIPVIMVNVFLGIAMVVIAYIIAENRKGEN